jgi:type I restriction enzyme S subunit
MNKINEKGLLPALRFPEFQGKGKWELKPLKKLAKRCTEKNRDGRIVRVLTNSAEHGIVDQREYFDKDIAVQGNLEGYLIVEKGDFVYNPRISSRAPVGPISKNNISTGVMSPLYTVFRFKIENNDFYEHFFNSSAWHQYMRQVSSTGARHDRMAISSNDFIAMPLPITPTEAEQQKISDCLSSLDELITAHTQKHEALRSYKKGLIQNLFPVEGEAIPKLRFTEFKGAEDWVKLSIQDLIDKDFLLPPKDGNHGNIHPKSSDFVKDGIPFIMASNLKNGKIDFVGCSKIKKEQADNLQKGFSKVGDVLLSHKGTVGEVAVVPENKFPYIMLTPQVTYYRIKNKEKLNNYYLASAFLSEKFQNDLTVASGGGTRSYIGITEQRKLQLMIPENINEQKRIADCLSSVDNLIRAQAQKIEDLKAHKKGLMQQLFPAMDEVGE